MSNPFAQPARSLQLTVEAEPALLDRLEEEAEGLALAITRPLDDPTPRLIFLIDEAKQAPLKAMLAKAGKVTIRETLLDDIDWVSKVQKDFPPFRLGPFFVHGSHGRHQIPNNALPLHIDAAAAFGTGEHATTAGCLLMLAGEKKKRKAVRHALDMGCGTGILAIGMARLWKNVRLVASDFDSVAVRVARENLAINRVARQTRSHVSNGYKAHAVRQTRYDIIAANILARPLMKMARDARRSLAPGGTLILSGLLNEQEPMVLSAHRMQGLYLRKKLRRGRWSVLVVR